MKKHINIFIYIVIVTTLVCVMGAQYISLNRYKLWASNDLKNSLVGIGAGILSNERTLTVIIQTKEMSIEQADDLIDNNRNIYKIKDLQEFASQVLGYEFKNTSQTLSKVIKLRENVEELLSQKDRFHNNKITLTQEELAMFQPYLELYKHWTVAVHKTYKNISLEGASQAFFREHENMIKNQDWVPFIKNLN